MSQFTTHPRIKFTIGNAQKTFSIAGERILVLGQSNDSAVTTGALVTNIANGNAEDALFGAKEHITSLIRALKLQNKETPVDAIAVNDNGSGVNATGSVAFAGTATEAGTIIVYIGDKITNTENKFTISVANGDTATVIGDALETAITAGIHAPVTASNTTGTVTLTARNAGTIGNDIGMLVEGTVAGITTTLTAMSGGATDPSTTGLLDPASNQGIRYTRIVAPFYMKSAVKTYLEDNFNVDNDILDGIGYFSDVDTFANFSNTDNSKILTIVATKLTNTLTKKAPALFVHPDQFSASLAGNHALRMTIGSDSTDVVVSGISRDNTGGLHNANLPHHNTPIRFLPTIPVGEDFTDSEKKSLNEIGFSTTGNNPGNTILLEGQAVTTDIGDTFKFLNAVESYTAIRSFIFSRAKSRFAQSRLASGESNGISENASTIKAFLMGEFKTLASFNYTLIVDEQSFFEELAKEIDKTIAINLANGEVVVDVITKIATQLRSFIITMIPQIDN